MLLTTFLVGTSVVLPGQQQADQKPPAFEVASIKPDTTPGPVSLVPTPGGFRATNAAIGNLITIAYRIQWFRVVGDSKQLADRFDVIAKTPEGIGDAKLPEMLQALLAERFKLKAHFENREQPIYALTIAKNDGRLGPGLRRSTVDCAAVSAERETHRTDQKPIDLPCGSSFPSAGRLKLIGMPIATLANYLTPLSGRIVKDQTGLSGTYDVTLTFSEDASGTSVFTAVEEQLGLKLQSARDHVEMLVIDHVEKPTPD